MKASETERNRPLTDTMDEVAYRELQSENKELKKRAQEAEGELTIIKGIGNTSPEMKSLKLEVEALKQQLHTDRNKHQKEIKNLQWVKEQDYIFLVDENKHLHKEIREIRNDNRKLSLQIEDKVNQLRRSGL
jgi:predicted phage-related endonuclease